MMGGGLNATALYALGRERTFGDSTCGQGLNLNLGIPD